MAPSLSNAKVLSAVLVNTVSAAVKRRSFSAAASQEVVKTVAGRAAVMVKKTGEEKVGSAAEGKVAWVPDPKTGVYRPENQAEEIDVAELRAMLLKQKH